MEVPDVPSPDTLLRRTIFSRRESGLGHQEPPTLATAAAGLAPIADAIEAWRRLMGRATCEGCMSIDVRSWHRERLLCAGQRFSHALTWMGEPTEGVDVVTGVDSVVLIFRSRSWEASSGKS
jgi:hypothetical protein